jgi:pyruvate-formate lyase-activating enzyme
MGFKVGLHTGGGYPARFREILPLMDWVGMDIKTGFESYSEITGRDGSGEKALESAKMLLKSGIFHEFRTTIHPLRHSKALLLQLAKDLAGLGAKSWVLQEFRAQGCAEESLRRGAVPLALDSEFLTEVHSLFENFQVRRA